MRDFGESSNSCRRRTADVGNIPRYLLCVQVKRRLLFGRFATVFSDAVLEIARLRQEGMAALAIVVQHHDTPPEMLANADIVVQGVEGMANLLREMVDEIVVSKQA